MPMEPWYAGKFRLFARPESRVEHVLHTVRALVAPPIVWLLYVAPPGPLLAVGILIALDKLAAVVHVSQEEEVRSPRARSGIQGAPDRTAMTMSYAAKLWAASRSRRARRLTDRPCSADAAVKAWQTRVCGLFWLGAATDGT